MFRLKWFLVTTSMCCMIVPSPICAAEANVATCSQENSCCDVALDAGGNLHAGVFDTNAMPLTNRQLALVQNGQIVASGQTDQSGALVFARVAGGTYQLRTPSGAWMCRVWTASAAPPSAKPRLAVVESPLVVRGQGCSGVACDPASFSAFEPILITALLVAAIAVPIAVHDSGDDPPGS